MKIVKGNGKAIAEKIALKSRRWGGEGEGQKQ